jgi:hypothetical protein
MQPRESVTHVNWRGHAFREVIMGGGGRGALVSWAKAKGAYRGDDNGNNVIVPCHSDVARR